MYAYSFIPRGAVAPAVVEAAERGLVAECGERMTLKFFVSDAPYQANLWNDFEDIVGMGHLEYPKPDFETEHRCAYMPVKDDEEGQVWINAELDAEGVYACARGGAFAVLSTNFVGSIKVRGSVE